MLGLVPTSCVEGCVWENELCTPVLSCNSSVEVLLWKVLCGNSGKPSVWRRGRRAVARTSKHIFVFTFDPLSLDSISLLYLALLYFVYIHVLDIVCVCPHLCWTKRASYRPQLFREISRSSYMALHGEFRLTLGHT